jgi:hypothetical protein
MSFKLPQLSVPKLSLSTYITDISFAITSLSSQNICFRYFKKYRCKNKVRIGLMGCDAMYH